jgi:hypothetical protein
MPIVSKVKTQREVKVGICSSVLQPSDVAFTLAIGTVIGNLSSTSYQRIELKITDDNRGKGQPQSHGNLLSKDKLSSGRVEEGLQSCIAIMKHEHMERVKKNPQ